MRLPRQQEGNYPAPNRRLQGLRQATPPAINQRPGPPAIQGLPIIGGIFQGGNSKLNAPITPGTLYNQPAQPAPIQSSQQPSMGLPAPPRYGAPVLNSVPAPAQMNTLPAKLQMNPIDTSTLLDDGQRVENPGTRLAKLQMNPIDTSTLLDEQQRVQNPGPGAQPSPLQAGNTKMRAF